LTDINDFIRANSNEDDHGESDDEKIEGGKKARVARQFKMLRIFNLVEQ
jgi:hypothetical protein